MGMNGMDEFIDNKWFLNRPEQFHWAVWNDEEDAVLFHGGAGNTLMLNPLGEYLLKALLSDPKNIEELCRGAAHYFDIDNNQDLHDVALSSMQQFRYIGLVLTESS